MSLENLWTYLRWVKKTNNFEFNNQDPNIHQGNHKFNQGADRQNDEGEKSDNLHLIFCIIQ